MKTEALRFCIQTQYGKEDYDEARKEITDIEYEISELTAGSEAMQEDARNNTATINAQAEEIRTLKGIARNLAKHLEAINNICERGDEFIPTEVGRAIRKHCESANVMEAL